MGTAKKFVINQRAKIANAGSFGQPQESIGSKTALGYIIT